MRARATNTLAGGGSVSCWSHRTFLPLAVTVLLSLPLWAQQQDQVGPDVFCAVAPEWPTIKSAKAQQPYKETVLVRIEVDGFGNVVDTKLLTSNSAFSDSALHAASLWKFAEPAADPCAKLLGMTATLRFDFEVLPSSTSPDEAGTAFLPPYEVSLKRLATRNP